MVSGIGYTDIVQRILEDNTLSNKLIKNDVEEDIVSDTQEFLNNLGRKGFGVLQLQAWFATNENWTEFLPFMEGKRGVYIGIGYGGQNLSSVAKGDFDKVVIVDNNLFVTEGFIPHIKQQCTIFSIIESINRS
ncbi:hypothetical protein ACFL3D_02900, partial [Candidatus Omnitrophota bacterium]